MRALQAIMNSFKLEMRAIIAESRSRSSSSTPQQQLSSPSSSNQVIQSAKQAATQQTVTSTPYAPQLDPPSTITQQQSNSPAKQKRNERTRQQYKRRALHVTMQLSVKEVKHTKQTKSREHIVSKRIVSKRIKLISWD